MRDVHPEGAQFRIEACDFLEARLDVADVGDLGAQMKVDQLDDVEPAGGAQAIHGFHQLRGIEAELGLLAAALLPPAVARACKLDANAGGGSDAQFLSGRQQHVDLAELLDDDEHLVSQLLAHERKPHELIVLVAVADDEVLRAFGQAEHRLEFRLGAALEPHAVLGAELHDLLDHVALLVDLDGIHSGVAARVFVLVDGVAEPLAQRFDARPQDIRKAEQHGQRDPLFLEVVRELVQAQLAIRVLLVRADDDVPAFVDVKETCPPSFDVVEVAGLLDIPGGRVVFHVQKIMKCAEHGPGQGYSTSVRHPSPSRTKTWRSWSLLGMPCQNSTREGTMRNPDQCGGRGTSRPSYSTSTARTLASRSPGCMIRSLWRDAHAPIWLPRGRPRKYASASAVLTTLATPSTRTCFSMGIQWKHMATCGCARTSRPLRLS